MDILTKKIFGRASMSWILCLLIYALCLIPGNSLIVSAQERNVIRDVTVEVDEGEVAEDDIFIMDEDIIFIDDFDMEDESAGTGTGEAETPVNRKKRPSQEELSGRNSEDAFPPESLKIMEEEGISPEDLKDPKVAKRLREKMEQRKREEGEKDSQQENKALKGLELYTSVIVKKNLFLQLGSGEKKREPEYALTAVLLSNTPEETESRAIIERKGGGESYYVVKGDTFAGEIKVVDIENTAVKLDNSGKEIELSLGEGAGGG